MIEVSDPPAISTPPPSEYESDGGDDVVYPRTIFLSSTLKISVLKTIEGGFF